jgi:hypothetical protein
MTLTIPLFSLLTLLYGVLVHCILTNATDIVPSSVQPGPSVAQFVSSKDGFGMDGPKVHPINGSSYDWWYFDAVASDGLSSVVINFYTAAPGGFPFPFDSPNSSVVLASVSGSFANGSLFDIGSVQGTSATIETAGDGSSGTWQNTGFAWSGNTQATEYAITVDSAETGIKGSVTLQSVGGLQSHVQFPTANSTRMLTSFAGRSTALSLLTWSARRTHGSHARSWMGECSPGCKRHHRSGNTRISLAIQRSGIPRQGASKQ